VRTGSEATDSRIKVRKICCTITRDRASRAESLVHAARSNVWGRALVAQRAPAEDSGLTNLTKSGVGVRVRVLMSLAGHSNMATTHRYIDLRPTIIKAVMESV
jgi:hypothetical protein